ncbi:hypothetical protein EDC01DRAFT_667467 [Geopyxis carbonaria]|nr:hypothetical protein EDC01DRAFT_667467 [Geopyxis carbonaria]
MWAAVATRHHVVSAVYPSADDKDELMLHGTVDYTLKTGRALRSEWAARMVFAPGDEERMQFYQVYLDASPMVVAMGKRIEADEEGNVRIV